MTPDERQQSLTNARRACKQLVEYAAGEPVAIAREDIACLLFEFTRLDEKEQAQIKAGRASGKLGAKHGVKGGRPKKKA